MCNNKEAFAAVGINLPLQTEINNLPTLSKAQETNTPIAQINKTSKRQTHKHQQKTTTQSTPPTLPPPITQQRQIQIQQQQLFQLQQQQMQQGVSNSSFINNTNTQYTPMLMFPHQVLPLFPPVPAYHQHMLVPRDSCYSNGTYCTKYHQYKLSMGTGRPPHDKHCPVRSRQTPMG